MMSEENATLFDELPQASSVQAKVENTVCASGQARVLMPNRGQMEFRASDLDSLLPEGHRARLVWDYVVRLDLAELYAQIKAVEGGVGRSRIAPEILLALWLYATLEGVGTARGLARLCEAHDAYRWICGGVQVNYHTLADFRVGHATVLDALLTVSVANLMDAGVVKLKRVAHDGVRVRASAGAASFRRKHRLEGYLEAARQQVDALKQQVADDPCALSRREKAARERAARERQERIERALERLPEMQQAKRRQGKDPEQARASSTDSEATVMKMADGGYRPAYNAQLCSDTEAQVIVGIEVVTSGSDLGQLSPMVEQVQARYGATPDEYLVDGGYPAHAQIDAVADKTVVYAPVPKAKEGERDPHEAHAGDSEAVASWRSRMATDEAKSIYKDRAATAECVNAQARNRGMIRLPVRGSAKVKCVVLLYVLAHNLMRIAALAPQLLGIGTGPSSAASLAISSGQFA
jgi:transposase